MPDLTHKSDPELFLNLILHGLRVKDEKLNSLAAEILVRQGARSARTLVLEAASKKNSVPHRLRVLAVIERMGQLSGPDDWLDLNVLATDKNPKIRDAAARCLVRHSPAPAEAVAGG